MSAVVSVEIHPPRKLFPVLADNFQPAPSLARSTVIFVFSSKQAVLLHSYLIYFLFNEEKVCRKCKVERGKGQGIMFGFLRVNKQENI